MLPIPGTVYWITGLAGAGKTTIGKRLYEELKQKKTNVVFLDGDTLREVFAETLSYSLEDRFKLSMKYARLCQMLSSQGLDVICATVSMFDKCREWNRGHLSNYFEIYVRVPIEVLKRRDQKHLYSSLKGQVVGIDLPFEEPKNPDLILDNDGVRSPQELCADIFNCFNVKGMK